ncbi:DUF6943 family protein [Flavobacterium noncentrifugens]|uniref:Uncharacterized protein n=1 Tax=Flavobacterium noncentrifugens TaxID=1128970 RepID=A0A1G8ZJ58_9FLAO|nr:hypothetical protein [Flavobacterium noncentrifugens]SDK15162.1 hypothetical protein SAMN04487935_2625 [Flavobacterium noncentrifugens]
MQTIKIKTHSPKNTYQKPHFFILNKGMNSGKPLTEACLNCFVLEFADQAERENYYWLAFGLWQSKFWHLHLVGSVIVFLRINEFKNLFISKASILQKDYEQHLKNVHALKVLKEKEMEFYKSITLIKELRSAVLRRYLQE